MNHSGVVPEPLFTRPQAAAYVGLSPAEFTACERAGALEPTHPGTRGEFAQARYDLQALLRAYVVAAGYRMGLRGRFLTRLRSQLEDLSPTLAPGQRGWVVLVEDAGVHWVPELPAASIGIGLGMVWDPNQTRPTTIVPVDLPDPATLEAAA